MFLYEWDVRQGSITRGLAKAMSDIFSSITHTGVQIFETIATGVKSITNSTADVIDVAATDLSQIFSFAGGATYFHFVRPQRRYHKLLDLHEN